MRTTPPTKTARAEAIEQCALMVGKHCGIDPRKMFTGVQTKSAAVRDARALFVYHLHQCGMSFLAIGKLVGRTEDHVRRTESQGAIRMMGEDHKLIDRLPKIPSTLEIVRTEVPPVIETQTA